MSRGSSLALVLSIVALATPARAWSPIAGSQPAWSGPAPYALNSAGSADLGGFSGTESLVRQGFDDWARVSCSSLRTQYTGTTSGTAFQGGSNTVSWFESGWIDDPNAIGITGPSWDGSNAILSAEMAMNGVHFTWTTESGSGNRVNAYSIILHEAGHYFGLGHSSSSEATMYYAYTGGVDALTSDDQEGICTLYAGGGGGTSDDCRTSGCPSGQSCVDGRCVESGTTPPPTGNRVCTSCTQDTDCGGGGARCLRYPSGMFCGGGCSTDADCSGAKCEEVTDGSKQCVRRDTAGNADCSATPPPDVNPNPGGGTTGPSPGTPPASCTNDAQCGTGKRCENGACVMVSTNALGDRCMGNEECQSALCAVDIDTQNSFCTQLCTTAMPCPNGFACEDAGGGLSACKPMLGGIGAMCTGPSDCLSGMCAETDASRFCTRTCADDGACPSGFDCVETADGASSLCVEGEGGSATQQQQSGGCAVGGNRNPPVSFFLFLLFTFVFRRRRTS